MKKFLKCMCFAFALILSLTACGQGKEPEEGKTSQESKVESIENPSEPTTVKIENFDMETEYTKIPERVVALNYDAAQILTALGVEDRIVGVATAEGSPKDCLPEYQDKLSKLKVIIEGTPNLELLLAQKPDFVYGTVYAFGPRGVAPVEDFKSNGINIYCMNGTCSKNPAFEDIYKDIEDMGKIFKAEDKAKVVVDSLKEREKKLASSPKTEVKVLGFDGGEKTAVVAGKGIEDKIISLAGGNNIFSDLPRAFDEVSWEEIAAKNPDIILIHDYDTGITAGDVDEKIQVLKNNPAMKNTTAVKNENFVIVKLVEVFPGMQAIDAAERLAEKIQSVAK